ncbi:trichohyalin-like [Pieris rapae]|uniref:trichohyalin-like n=1 Tax=Pieris rapae TaxID=64459 RepID=UPI001E27FF16|nr:trichohyalin-like [Pieris rapae]
MARQKKLSDLEKKLKKKEYDRKRREKVKNNTESLEKLREKERLKYIKKKEKGQVKSVVAMNARELRQKRKQWKKNSKVYRDKKDIARKDLQRVLDDTPPQSPSVLQQSREDIAARNRRQMRRRRAILYARIVNLEKRVKNAVKLSEKYKKRYLRLKTKNTDPESPTTKVNTFLKNVQVPDLVKKKLLFGEALSKDLKTSYDDLGKKHENKKKYYNMLKLKSLHKYKLLHAAKPFFKHDTSKRQKPRKISAKMLKVKDDVIKFLEKDENTRMCPGKKDYLKSKEGKTQQKRVLYDTLYNLHQKFLGTVNYKISLATFCKFRPFWITWQNVNERNTCKCVKHANIELMISKLHEVKALKFSSVTAALASVTCNVHSTKCLFRECSTCKERTLEYYLPMPNQLVTYRQWIYEVSSFEKDGKQRSVRKPVKKEYRVKLKQLVQDLEAALPVFFQHVGTIAHQYQAIQNIKNNLTINDVLIHVDFSENYCCKYNEEIQAVHFGGARQQITMHTGVLYLRNGDTVKPVSFCSLSSNNRHDTTAITYVE